MGYNLSYYLDKLNYDKIIIKEWSNGEIRVYQFEDDSLMLQNDLYQLNMAESYWNDGIHERMAVLIYISEVCLSMVDTLYSMVLNV